MALMHKTTMAPTKLELLAAWLPAQPWFSGDVHLLESLGGYRIDDSAGEVGIEGILLTAGDETVYHVPLTYRGAALENGEEFLLGTSEHGVLGTRWISDAIGDPVFRAALAETIAHGGQQADEFVQDEHGNKVSREPLIRVQGSGRAANKVADFSDAVIEQLGRFTRAEQDLAVLDVVRVVDPSLRATEDQYSLTGTRVSNHASAVLALMYDA